MSKSTWKTFGIAVGVETILHHYKVDSWKCIRLPITFIFYYWTKNNWLLYMNYLNKVIQLKKKNFHTLLENVFFLSFGFKSSTEKVSKRLFFQAQIMICSWILTFFSNKEHFWFQKKNNFSTITVLDLNLFFFRVFVLRVSALTFLCKQIGIKCCRNSRWPPKP
jgi:hypothetical protein